MHNWLRVVWSTRREFAHEFSLHKQVNDKQEQCLPLNQLPQCLLVSLVPDCNTVVCQGGEETQLKLVNYSTFFCKFPALCKILRCPYLIPNDPNHQTNAQTSFLGHERRWFDTFPIKNGAFLAFTEFHPISGWGGSTFQLFLIMDITYKQIIYNGKSNRAGLSDGTSFYEILSLMPGGA